MSALLVTRLDQVSHMSAAYRRRASSVAKLAGTLKPCAAHELHAYGPGLDAASRGRRLGMALVLPPGKQFPNGGHLIIDADIRGHRKFLKFLATCHVLSAAHVRACNRTLSVTICSACPIMVSVKSHHIRKERSKALNRFAIGGACWSGVAC